MLAHLRSLRSFHSFHAVLGRNALLGHSVVGWPPVAISQRHRNRRNGSFDVAKHREGVWLGAAGNRRRRRRRRRCVVLVDEGRGAAEVTVEEARRVALVRLVRG